MKKGKKYILLASVAAVLCIAAVCFFWPRKIDFYHQFPFRYVSDENKALAKSIFHDYEQQLTQLMVAEDSRSNKAMRFVFVSDAEMERQTCEEILQRLFARMLELQEMQVQHTSTLKFPRIWEVYFYGGDHVYSAFISRCGADNILGNEDDQFSDWEAIPTEVMQQLPMERLVAMLQDTARPLYGKSARPISEMTPEFPRPKQ